MTIYHTPSPGERIADEYDLVRKVAKGGFATVWEATRTGDGSVVAIKFMLPNKVDDPKVVERFRREARLVQKLDHNNIVKVFAYGVTEPESDAFEGVPYLVMEFLRGQTLEDVIMTSKGPVTPRRAVTLLVPVLDGLSEAHKFGVIHRDLKPENIFVEEDGELETPKLLDFGICKRLESSPFNTGGDALTATDQVFGTPEYMAPEQVAADPISEATDVYAAGIMLYELLAGRRPFVGATPLKVMLAHLDDPMPPLPGPYQGTGIAAVVERATHKAPKRRFESALAMRNALLDLPDAALTDRSEAVRAHAAGALHNANTAVNTKPKTAVVRHYAFDTLDANPIPPAGGRTWLVAVFAGLAAMAILVVLALVSK